MCHTLGQSLSLGGMVAHVDNAQVQVQHTTDRRRLCELISLQRQVWESQNREKSLPEEWGGHLPREAQTLPT